MATYSERYAIAGNNIFVGRVRQAVLEAAVSIYNEDPDAPNHAIRAALAAKVIAYPEEWARRFGGGVANNGNVGSGTSDPSQDSSDGDSALGFVVSSLWDSFAASAT